MKIAPDGWFDARDIGVPKTRLIELAKAHPDMLESHRDQANIYFKVRRCRD
jgi:hypothetical protein